MPGRSPVMAGWNNYNYPNMPLFGKTENCFQATANLRLLLLNCEYEEFALPRRILRPYPG